MYHIVIKVLFLLAALIWGDWRNWRDYYPTILFFAIGDLLYQYIFYHYPMWLFHHSPGMEDLPLSLIFFSMLLITYPSTTLIFLGRFPKGFWRGGAWVILWVAIYTGIEIADLLLGVVSYHHGWSLWWSIVFNIAMFCLVKLHHHRPLLTWPIAIIWIILLWKIFAIPISVLK